MKSLFTAFLLGLQRPEQGISNDHGQFADFIASSTKLTLSASLLLPKAALKPTTESERTAVGEKTARGFPSRGCQGSLEMHSSTLNTLHTLSSPSKDAASWEPCLKLPLHHPHLQKLRCLGAVTQGKLYPKGKANQPLDRVNIFAVLCSQLAYIPLKRSFLPSRFFPH